MKRKLLAFLTIAFFFLYLIASSRSDFLANLLSPVFCMLVAFDILLMIRKDEYFRVGWFLLALAPISWAVSDIGWFITDSVLGYDPDEILAFTYVYLLPNIFFLVTISFYFLNNIKKWHRVKLLLDLLVMFVIVLGIGSGMIFSVVDYSGTSLNELVGLLAYVILDLLTLLIAMVLISSAKLSKVKKFLWLIMVSFLIYFAADLIYYFEAVADLYVANSMTDILFMVSFLFLGFAGLSKGNFGVDPINDEVIKTPENLFKTKLVLSMSLLPVILFLLNKINLSHMTMILLAIAIYQFVNVYVQRNYMFEQMIVEKNKMTKQLEAMVEDRTRQLIEINQALYTKSTVDGLTGLYNRAYFLQEVEKAIENGDKTFSILYLDMNRFKVINDVHGHSMGDEILKLVAKRFRFHLGHHYTYARLGGDEFGVLIESVQTQDLEGLVSKIKLVFEEAFLVEEYSFHLGVSIGAARYPKDAKTIHKLLQYADIAMYHAKKEEVNEDFVLYSTHLVEAIERRNHIELLLRDAKYDQEFKLYYQPKFYASSRQLFGMEALIRWIHPQEGFISPGEFIPIAEDSGLILQISDWVFEKAVSQIVAWNRTYDKKYTMSMNVSSISLDTYDFIPKIRELMRKYQVVEGEIELEITERSAMSVATHMEEIFTTLTGEGVLISLDDFGTGYSSLSYIKRFDVDILKIAKELVDNLTVDDESLPIINAIIMMAKALELFTIAEGVETEDQLAILSDLGCDAIQGYVLGKPMPAEEFEATFLKTK